MDLHAIDEPPLPRSLTAIEIVSWLTLNQERGGRSPRLRVPREQL